MFPHLLTVHTTAGLSLIEETVITPTMRDRIESSSGFMLCCASYTGVQPLGQHRLYLRLNDFLVPFSFGVMKNFPPKLQVGTTFCDRQIENKTPSTKQGFTRDSRTLPILAINDDNISAIHTPQPLTPHHIMKENVLLRLAD